MKFLNIFLITIILYQLPVQLFAFQTKPNTITIRGIEDEKSKEIYRQVQFYASYFNLQGVNILVNFSNHMPEHVEGFTSYQGNEYSKSILIKINARLSFSAKELTLAHEMVHVKQFVTGELEHHKDNHFTWKGRVFKNIQRLNYKDRGWEEEAFKNEKTILKLYRSHKAAMI